MPGLVLVGGEQVEVLVALGEVEAGVAHVRAGLRGHDVERLLGEPSAKVNRHPAHERVAGDLHALGRDVVDLARPPVLEVRELDARAGARVQLEAAGMEGLPADWRGEAVLAHRALGVLVDHRKSVCVLRSSGLVDQVDDLDRRLDAQALRHVDERAAGPERSGGRRELPLVVGEAAHVPLADQVRVLLDRPFERGDDQALRGQLGVHRVMDGAGATLDDQPGEVILADVLRHERGQVAAGVVVARLEPVEVELAQRGRPEARPPPGGNGLALVDLERRPAAVLQPAVGSVKPRHRPWPPPRG